MPIFGPEELRKAVMDRLASEPQQSTPAPDQGSNGIGLAPYLVGMGGQGADLATTIAGLNRPGARETNPIGAGPVIASKVALTAALPFVMKWLADHGHPTGAKVVGYGAGAAGAIPAAWNIGQMSK